MSFACNINIDCQHFIYNTSTQVYDTFASNSTSIALIGDITTTLQIPDIKVLDFLNGIFKMFNLTSYVDFNDENSSKRLDDYYDEGDNQILQNMLKQVNTQ